MEPATTYIVRCEERGEWKDWGCYGLLEDALDAVDDENLRNPRAGSLDFLCLSEFHR